MARHYRRSVGPLAPFGVGLVLIALVVAYQVLAPFPYRSLVVQTSQSLRMSPYLVAAVIRVESGFRPDVVSARGAQGLMQLLPSTAYWIAQKSSPGFRGPLDLKDPRLNIRLGAWYLRYLMNRFHRHTILALAAYNGGPRTVRKWIEQHRLDAQDPRVDDIPFPETRHFVQRVMTYEKVYAAMYGWWPSFTH